MNYDTIQPYYELLKDHPLDFAYYGEPKDEYYLTYPVENENGDHLVISYECNELCEELGFLLREENVQELEEGSISEEMKEYLCTKANEKEVRSYAISLIDTLSYNDYFIACLQDGFLVRLIGYLLSFTETEQV